MKTIESKTEYLIPLFNILPLITIFVLEINKSTFSFIIGTLIIALSIIYTGSHRSIKLIDPEDEDQNSETLSMQDALTFPIQIGVVLAILYYLVKNFKPELINSILRIYFSGTSLYAGTLALTLWMECFMSDARRNAYAKEVYSLLGQKFTFLNVVAFVLVAFLVIIWYSTNSLWSGNVLAYLLSVLVSTQISFDKFSIGYVVMWALFVFDILMVFKSDIMVTVAREIDLPLGIRSVNEEGKKRLMGLGDIIFPALFIAMSYRFDCTLALKAGQKDFVSKYLLATILGYVLGYFVCFYINIVYNHPQPALLYLVPGVTISFGLTALISGEIASVIEYSESVDKEKREVKTD